MQKKLEELEEKIQRIEFDQDTIEAIKKEKEETENKINDLIKYSKENFSENFCGAAFIVFNTIKEKEDFLSQFQNNCCYRFIDIILIYLNLFFNFYSTYCCCFCCCCCCCCNYCSCCCTKEESLDYYKKHIKIERAPEPEDVIFENLEVSQLKRFSKTIVGSILSLIYCSVCSAFTFILYFLQKITDKRKEQSKKTILLYLMSFIITIITSAIV